MRARVEQRLRELKAEYEAGQKQLVQLNQRREDLERTLQRISGAILVLQELQDFPGEAKAGDAVGDAASARNGVAAHADVV